MSQSGLLAQGEGFGEWINILIIVIMAVFWLIGGLAKSLNASKKKQQPDARRAPMQPVPHRTPTRETWLQQLARKAEEIQKAAAEHIKQQSQGRQPERPQPPRRAAPVPATHAAPAVERSVAKGPKRPTPITNRSQTGRAEYRRHPLIDFSEPDALRAAILHYEILGKPLSLRDPSGPASGF